MEEQKSMRPPTSDDQSSRREIRIRVSWNPRNSEISMTREEFQC